MTTVQKNPYNSTGMETQNFLLVGSSECTHAVRNQLINKYGLESKPVRISRGINYSFFQKESVEEIEKDNDDQDISFNVGIYTVNMPLLNRTYLRKLTSIISSTESIGIIYTIDATKWNKINEILDSKCTIEEARGLVVDELLAFFDILYHSNKKWQFIHIVLSETSQWAYGMNMQMLDFLQQNLRCLLVSNKAIEKSHISYSFKTPSNKLMYLPNHITDDVINTIFAFNKHDVTRIDKYCDLIIDSKFDSMEKIQIIDDSFVWSEWEPIFTQIEAQDSTQPEANQRLQEPGEEQPTESFQQYMQAWLEKKIQTQ